MLPSQGLGTSPSSAGACRTASGQQPWDVLSAGLDQQAELSGFPALRVPAG